MKIGFVLPFVFLSICAFAGGKENEMERAKVISQDLNSSAAGTYTAPVGTARVSVPVYRRSNIVVVQTSSYEYQWSESGNKTIILPVNGEIEFYRDGNWFIVLDSKNKKHKFALVGMTALSPTTTSSTCPCTNSRDPATCRANWAAQCK
jgi:hypothetical protein